MRDGVSLSLSGMTALVTGASSGVGPSLAKRLDEAGAKVVIHYHQNKAGAVQLSKELRQPGEIVQANLGEETEVRTLFNTAMDKMGPINILVNCAAAESQNVSNLAELTIERWTMTQRTNVDAPLILTQMFAQQGIAGSVINISSIEGSRPARGHGHYSTSKAALEMLTRSCALEFGDLGVRVNAVAPGLIWRDGIEEGWPEGVAAWKEAAPLGKLAQPGDIANAVLFLASDASAFITGTVITVDGGMSIAPGW